MVSHSLRVIIFSALLLIGLIRGQDPVSPPIYRVQLDTNVVDPATGSSPSIVLEVNRTWAPLGSDRFYALLQDKYYDGAAFFRVVPDFIVQFGIAALPEETAKWSIPIPDDPVLESNLEGYVSFATAGPDTRTTQLFINYVDNSFLDSEGFSPFAKVVSGMSTAIAIVNPTPGNSNGVNQELYTQRGNEWVLTKYPNISLITKSFIVSDVES
jgi:peptidyl-prolyl cis-trans isomerase A (cyclophilin A)